MAGRIDDIRFWATLRTSQLLSIRDKQVASLSLTEVHDDRSFVTTQRSGVQEGRPHLHGQPATSSSCGLLGQDDLSAE